MNWASYLDGLSNLFDKGGATLWAILFASILLWILIVERYLAHLWQLPAFRDQLRQEFIDQTVPQIEVLGLELSDPQLRWNEQRGHYDFGPIDWNEFYRVIKGNGPCNRQRLQHHIKAERDGDWVREAVHAYDEKKKKRGRKAA